MTDCKGCEQCAHEFGDQAEDEEGRELIRLRAENAELRREIERRDELLQGSSPAAIAELVASGVRALHGELVAEVERLTTERERTIFERSADLAAGEKAVVVAKALRDQRNDLVRALTAVAEHLDISDWTAIAEDPSVVLRGPRYTK